MNSSASIDLKLPVWESADAELFFWGHIDRLWVYPALLRQIKRYSLLSNEFGTVDPVDIQHVYARKRGCLEEGYRGSSPFDSDDRDYDFILCAESDPDSFPVTYVDF